MPDPVSLDGVIRTYAAQFAEHLQATAAKATKEEEIRIAGEKQLALLESQAGITLDGRHEFTVASGRADSVYERVVIEYKNPSSPGSRIGTSLGAPGSRKVVAQIQQRFSDLENEYGHPINSLFGVGLDGKRFIFVRWREKRWEIQEPVEVTAHSAERFLWALFNLGQRGKPFAPEYLARDFGSDAGLARSGVRTLYEAITGTKHPKALMFFSQWETLFGEVCGYDIRSPSDRVKKLATSYGIATKGLKPAHLLFALHTYYAIFMKLLASEIVAYFHKLPTPLERLMRAATSEKLLRELRDLEGGSIFQHLNIVNFLEGDLFSWYLEAWNEGVNDLVRNLVAALDDYNPGTLSEDPGSSRDLLKHLYQELIPRTVRHDLGEYYTPDWLAEYTLDEAGYAGNPDHRLLDPACGSGTFLVLSINRVRAWYEEHRERCDYDEGELFRKILANIVGFDLNPLAVMAARTNFLIAVRDLIAYGDRVELPVYLCDSILTVEEQGGLFGGHLGETKKLKTAVKTFVIPTEIAGSREDVARYTDELAHAVAKGYSAAEFLERCQEEGLPITARQFHSSLYEDLVGLSKANKNGVWARIIKNAFAPLFVGRFDFVVGNPPWINWESLPKDYRESTIEVWDKYQLRERKSKGVRLGNVKKELSALFVYVCMDHYLAPDGTLAFVITQSVFKSGANEGFRAFRLGPGKPLRVKLVADLSLCLPFANVINRTAVLVANPGKGTNYPLAYSFWVPGSPRLHVPERSLRDVLKEFDVHGWLAAPVEPSNIASPWLTAPPELMSGVLQKVIGDRQGRIMDRAFAGSITWLSGVYWVEVLKRSKQLALIRNLGDVGKKKVEVVERSIETAFLFPLLRGRDLRAWAAVPAAHILVPHSLGAFSEPVALSVMKTKYPKTYAYLHHFEDEIRGRSGYKQLHGSRPEFYVVGNIHQGAKANYKVAFKDLSDLFQCAVIGPVKEGRPVIPDHSVLYLRCDSAEEGHFMAGLLNSPAARVALYCASVGVQTQRYFPTDVARVRVPEFRPGDTAHREIARLSEECHTLAEDGNAEALKATEAELAHAAAAIWGITAKELDKVLATYDAIRRFRRGAAFESGDDDDNTFEE
jgi:hypothetical protein